MSLIVTIENIQLRLEWTEKEYRAHEALSASSIKNYLFNKMEGRIKRKGDAKMSSSVRRNEAMLLGTAFHRALEDKSMDNLQICNMPTPMALKFFESDRSIQAYCNIYNNAASRAEIKPYEKHPANKEIEKLSKKYAEYLDDNNKDKVSQEQYDLIQRFLNEFKEDQRYTEVYIPNCKTFTIAEWEQEKKRSSVNVEANKILGIKSYDTADEFVIASIVEGSKYSIPEAKFTFDYVVRDIETNVEIYRLAGKCMLDSFVIDREEWPHIYVNDYKTMSCTHGEFWKSQYAEREYWRQVGLYAEVAKKWVHRALEVKPYMSCHVLAINSKYGTYTSAKVCDRKDLVASKRGGTLKVSPLFEVESGEIELRIFDRATADNSIVNLNEQGIGWEQAVIDFCKYYQH